MIELFKLKAHPFAFPLYQNDNVYLIVSGLGKVNAALAVGYLQAQLPLSKSPAWLNIGIAGHRSLALGQAVIAHQVLDKGTMRSFYPTFTSPPLIKTHTLCTVDKPESTFPEDYVYEMEAAGFMLAALKFSTSELVHCYKIISDNQNESIKINAYDVQQLIENHLPTLEQFAKHLQKLGSEIPEISAIPADQFTEQWHFTATEKHQLNRLLKRLTCLTDEPISKNEFSHLAKADDVLDHLEKKINSLPLTF